jgi:phenylpyruvate tautomerase PptA (4-oxalocrotonate tautomerase family)
MPLVRISLMKGRLVLGRQIGAVVYRAMVDTIGVPVDDNFQVITEHDGDSLVYDPGYLGIRRTDGFVAVQITLTEGRTVRATQSLFRAIADGLRQELDVRPEDVFINLVEVKKENWSFGNGVAQYVPDPSAAKEEAHAR